MSVPAATRPFSAIFMQLHTHAAAAADAAVAAIQTEVNQHAVPIRWVFENRRCQPSTGTYFVLSASPVVKVRGS